MKKLSSYPQRQGAQVTLSLPVSDKTQRLVVMPTDPHRRLMRGGPQPDPQSARVQWSGLAVVLLVLAVLFTWKPVYRAASPAPVPMAVRAVSSWRPAITTGGLVGRASVPTFSPPLYVVASANAVRTASPAVQVQPAVPLPADSATFRLLR